MGIFDIFRKNRCINHPERFDTEEKEVIVLLRSGVRTVRSHGEKYASAYAAVLAYVDLASGQLVEGDTTLTWDISNSEFRSNSVRYNLKKETCCRCRVRPSVAYVSAAGTQIPAGRSLFMTKLLSKNCRDMQLERVLEEYCKPRSLTLSGNTELDFIREHDWYLGDITWKDEEAGVILHTDEGKFACADTAAAVFEKLYAQREEWDKKAREYAAKEMVENANEWAAQAGEDSHRITRAEFARRIGVPNIMIFNDGSFEFSYDDDDMFLGHVIVVNGTLEDGFTEAGIEG